MSKRDIGAEILDGIREIQQYKKGSIQLKTTELSAPSPPQVIRSKLKSVAISICRVAGH